MILSTIAESRAKELTKSIDFPHLFLEKKVGNFLCLQRKKLDEGKEKKEPQFQKKHQPLLPSVPVTGFLWHLRMVTSNLPFLFIENKIYKVIHTFFFFFCIFFVGLFFTDFENWEYSKYTFF